MAGAARATPYKIQSLSTATKAAGSVDAVELTVVGGGSLFTILLSSPRDQAVLSIASAAVAGDLPIGMSFVPVAVLVGGVEHKLYDRITDIWLSRPI